MQSRVPMVAARPLDASWADEGPSGSRLARSVVVQYVAIAVEVALGIVMLPFNVAHLGPAAYGLWVLTASITAYFSMLDLGYAAAQVKFAAQYRARRDAPALNEIASTLFFLFAALAAVVYAAALILSFNLGRLFALDPSQLLVGRQVLLVVSLYVALGLPFSVFGSISNGFQRHYLNTSISMAISLLVAAATFAVLSLGYGLVELVTVTTALRIAGLFAYRRTAFRAFPLLSVRWRHVRRARLREVTGFSAYLLVMDIAQKIHVTADTMVIGVFLGTAPIAVWAVAARLVTSVQRISQGLGRFVFPPIVDGATRGRADQLERLLVQGTRLSLAMVIPMALLLVLLADGVVAAWVGEDFAASIPIVRVLALVAVIRIGTSTAFSLLKGAGEHKVAAMSTVVNALANLGLSILLVQSWGLLGVAVGTLVPGAVMSACVQFPAACRRAQVTPRAAFGRAVWPALWPAAPTAAVVVGARLLFAPEQAGLIAATVLGALCYGTFFLMVAIPVEDRRWYVRRLLDVFRANEIGHDGRRRFPPPALHREAGGAVRARDVEA